MKAITFLEWFIAWDMEASEHLSYKHYVRILGMLSNFYSQPFKPELITELFKGWKESNTDEIEEHFAVWGKKGQFYFFPTRKQMVFFHKMGSTLVDDSHEYELPYLPATLNNFISDCQRAGIELTFKPEIVEIVEKYSK